MCDGHANREGAAYDGCDQACDEGRIISTPDTVVQEGAVMIRLFGADVTQSTM